MLKMVRWVERKGKRVEFGNIVGPYCGKPYVYQFPNEKLAKEFETFVKKEEGPGMPIGVPPEIWGQYKVKEAITPC
jgi:hypothetical protein